MRRSITALAVALSMGLLIHAAGSGVSIVLVLIMSAWVIAPIAAAELLHLDRLALAIAIGSLAIYAIDTVKRFSNKAAFVYVIVPLCAWAWIATNALVARRRIAR